jgi:uncharacterized SAM-binding protein YcdF (DUF218 family)
MVAGVASWMLIDQLGVPHIFGVGSDAGLIPFAISGALVGLTRLRRIPVYLATVLLVVTLVVAYTSIIVRPSKALIRSDSLPASADAVVALSAGVTADGYLTQEGSDRLLTALALVKAGVAPRLVITREERKTGRTVFTSAGDQQRISSLTGITNIITTGKAKRTHDEAVMVGELARRGGWKRIVLVTSPFHTRRACRTFEKAGLTVSCIPSESRDIAVKRLAYAHDRIQAFGMWLYETAGTLRYRQKGWI